MVNELLGIQYNTAKANVTAGEAFGRDQFWLYFKASGGQLPHVARNRAWPKTYRY